MKTSHAAQWITPDEIRDINLEIYRDHTAPYLRDNVSEHDIGRIKGDKISRILDAVGTFEQHELPCAWSQFMAFSAGTHPWPDANHRTAMLSFAQICFARWEWWVALPDAEAYELTTRSKNIRDPDRLARPRARYYEIAELKDPTHKYRQLYREYEHTLIIEDQGTGAIIHRHWICNCQTRTSQRAHDQL